MFASQGVIQNFNGAKEVTTVEGSSQTIIQGPVASQEAIKQLGTNGGGYANANSAHPYENPNGLTNMLQMWALLVIPFSLPFTFGRMAKDRRQGLAVLSAMMALWLVGGLFAMHFEGAGNSNLTALRGRSVDHHDPTGREHGGQGDPLRARAQRPLRQQHHRHLHRGGDLVARQLHRRRRRRPSRADHVRRGVTREASAPGSTAC